jgi:type I restriction enzyme, S subunit
MKWPLVRLDECTEIVSGATPSTSVATFWDGDICWATPKDLSELDGKYIDLTPRKITKSGLEACSAEVLPANSVLFSSRAPIGHVAINRAPMATNQGFKSFIPDRSKLDETFLFWWLNANRTYLQSLGNGATFKEVSKAVVARITIPLPPLDEQRRIAAILDQTDELRKKRRFALDRLEVLTRSIFIGLFGDPFSRSGKYPQTTLDKIFRFRTGKLDSNAAVPSGRFPFFTCAKEDFKIDTYAFDCEALLLAGNNANADYSVKHYKGKFNVYQRTYVITLLDEKNSYQYARFAFEYRLAELKRISKGTNTKYLTLELLNNIRITLPPADLQKKFADLAAGIESLKTAHSRHLAKLDALFASLQHRAFSGELLLDRAATELEMAG